MKNALAKTIEKYGLTDATNDELAFFGYEPATEAQRLRAAKAVAQIRYNTRDADRICRELHLSAGEPEPTKKASRMADMNAFLRSWLGAQFGDWRVEAVYKTGLGWRWCKAVTVCTKCGFRRTIGLAYLRKDSAHNCSRERRQSLAPVVETGERVIR